MQNIAKEKFQIIGIQENEMEAIARPRVSYLKDAWRCQLFKIKLRH